MLKSVLNIPLIQHCYREIAEKYKAENNISYVYKYWDFH